MTIFLTLITALAGIVGGFFLNILIMKLNFVQRTIDKKINTFESLITIWLKIRNHVVDLEAIKESSAENIKNNLFQTDEYKWYAQLNKMYGKSLSYVGKAILVSDNEELLSNIREFNEKFYRNKWQKLETRQRNDYLDNLLEEGIPFISRMRNDIKKSTEISSIFKPVK